MSRGRSLALHNGECAGLSDVPLLPVGEWRSEVIGAIEGGGRLSALFAAPAGEAHERLLTVVADPLSGMLLLSSCEPGGSYPSLTPDCPSAHRLERDLAESSGIVPEGHPWLRPVRFITGMARTGEDDHYTMEGEEVHEVAVGPVHAGVIEPGHFRFQCHGERVFHLEISLGYQYRGVERALIGGPDRRTPHYAETVAGDTTVGHAWACCQLIESLSGTHVPPRAEAVRGIALELERMANHAGDLGALAGDVGFLPTASFCGRLRGDLLNLTALVCGSRFGRGLVRPGGILHDIGGERGEELLIRLTRVGTDLAQAVGVLWRSPSTQARLDGTGTVDRETARQIGLVGPAARGCGLDRDVRSEFPHGIYRFTQIPASTWHSGDVFARAQVRWLELRRSAEFIAEQVSHLPGGAIASPCHGAQARSIAVSLVEGWRGEICHAAVTDDDGRFARYAIVDPSVHNWEGLALAMRNQPISDFPLCNKSFDLSYCGHDR